MRDAKRIVSMARSTSGDAFPGRRRDSLVGLFAPRVRHSILLTSHDAGAPPLHPSVAHK